jgi:hypothetical protein
MSPQFSVRAARKCVTWMNWKNGLEERAVIIESESRIEMT